MIGPAVLGDLGSEVLAQLAILLAAIVYGFAGIFGKRFKGLPPIVTASGQVTCSTLLMLPLVLMIDQPWILPMPGVASLLAVVGIALLSTALAYILYFRILASAGATNLLLVTFLIPISALLLGAAFLDEQVTLPQLVGMAAIGIGLALIDGRPIQWIRRPANAPSVEHR
jgi:drug/metabolite transporter (DMT)-like permease